MMTTLDGYYEGRDHDLSWHNTDDEFEKFAEQQLDEVDTLIFGRKTYEMMSAFWTSPQALANASGTAERMKKLNKVVFSKQAIDLDWENTTVSNDLAGKILELKSQNGQDIAVLGSSHLGKEMLENGLLDEVRIMINPVFIGEGSVLFEGLNKKLHLNSTRTFDNGNVLLVYTPRRDA